MPWFLQRSPLALGVPLEGSNTVAGLRTLERLRMAELLQAPEGRGVNGGGGGSWRRPYQRYKGPFIEQLITEDLKQAPKSWGMFWRGSDQGTMAQAYSLPASLDVLHERAEENFVTFLPNYLRLAAGVLLATFYLRPRALLGAAAVVYSMYRSAVLAFRRQQRKAAVAPAAATGDRNGRQQAPRSATAAAAAAAAADPNEQMVTAALTVVTWLLVAYTRCLPILLLGSAASLVLVLVHCVLHRAPSELRHKGRQLLGFTWLQVLGREAVPEGANPQALFSEIALASRQAATGVWQQGCRYCRYYALTAIDSVKCLFGRS